MSVLTKITGAVAQMIPDRMADGLGEADRFIGKPMDRLDGRVKVTGAATFSAEYRPDNLAYASLAYSTIAKGTIRSIDVGKAEAAAGVITVLTHLNAPKMKAPPIFSNSGGPDDGGSTVNVLNTDEISWNGQPIAIVVADTLDHAEYAASLLTATYKQEAAALSFQDAKASATRPKVVMGEDPEIKKGDAEAALAAASVRVDSRYTTPRHNPSAIEPHATIAAWHEGKLTLYDSSQFLWGVAHSLAQMFSMPEKDIRVLAPFVGGGFGGKIAMWSHVPLCALAAKVTGRPVKLSLPRAGTFHIVGGRTPSEQRVALGSDESGKLAALIHTGITAMSPDNDFPEQFSFPARHLYSADNVLIDQATLRLNMVANTFMRAPGESIGTFALESTMDELSYALGIDPIELRRRNEPECDPSSGTEFSSRHLLEAYQLGAEKFGWEHRPRQVRAQRDGDWLIGQGVASAYYPAIRLPSSARVRINADGTAIVQASAQEMGMGTATAQTQHAAELLGLPMEKVGFEYGDTSLPCANQAGGSSQTISLALAVQQAFEGLKKQLLTLAKQDPQSPLKDAALENVQGHNAGLARKDQLEAGTGYSAILTQAGKDYVEAEVTTAMPMEMIKYSMHSYGAQFCEVRVHAQTGEVRVSRWVAAFDCGRILNPKTTRSQLRGGIIMGIGAALTEEALFDERSGRIMNPSLAEYHVPVHADVPTIEVYCLNIPDPQTPIGAHGVGEIGITGVAAAVANAVYHATGKRVRDLPITLDKLL